MVVIQNSIHDLSINEQNLTDILQQVISDLGVGTSELLVRIVNATDIQNLNKTYRNQDKTTNVLSFPSDLPKEINEAILGDVVICSAVVRAEAQMQHKTFEHHLIHIVVHGTLHLLGYDHIEEDEAQVMEALEVEILHRLKIYNPY
jgi:probable rRNA maturation factor